MLVLRTLSEEIRVPINRLTDTDAAPTPPSSPPSPRPPPRRSLVGTLKGSQKMVADLEGDLTQMRGELDRERLTTQQQKRLAEELKTELTEALTTLALERLDNKRLSSSMQEELEYAQKYNSELEVGGWVGGRLGGWVGGWCRWVGG